MITGSLLRSLGIQRLNVGAGRFLARDYGDVATLYVDADEPAGEVRPHPTDDRLLLVDGTFVFLRHSVPNLPIESGSVEEITSEHLIEHLSPRDATHLCREARRLLAPGGVLRLSTPDLAAYVECYRGTPAGQEFGRIRPKALDEALRGLDYGEFIFDGADRPTSLADAMRRPVFLLNVVFQLWGHRWIYDFDELALLLEAAGFQRSAVRRVGFRQGRRPDLARWDNAYRSDESLYVEADA